MSWADAVFVGACLFCVWHGYQIGRREGRADAFAEVQRWHLEDEEALKRAAYREQAGR